MSWKLMLILEFTVDLTNRATLCSNNLIIHLKVVFEGIYGIFIFSIFIFMYGKLNQNRSSM